METGRSDDGRRGGMMRALLLVVACFASAALGASLRPGVASASVPDYMKTIGDQVKAIASELKQTNRHLKDMEGAVERSLTSELKQTNRHLTDMEDALERIQREYTK